MAQGRARTESYGHIRGASSTKQAFIAASRHQMILPARSFTGLQGPRKAFQELDMNYPHLHLMINHIPVLGTILALLLLTWALVTRRRDFIRLSLFVDPARGPVGVPGILHRRRGARAARGCAGIRPRPDRGARGVSRLGALDHARHRAQWRHWDSGRAGRTGGAALGGTAAMAGLLLSASVTGADGVARRARSVTRRRPGRCGRRRMCPKSVMLDSASTPRHRRPRRLSSGPGRVLRRPRPGCRCRRRGGRRP